MYITGSFGVCTYRYIIHSFSDIHHYGGYFVSKFKIHVTAELKVANWKKYEGFEVFD